jgi:hypothetical protein
VMGALGPLVVQRCPGNSEFMPVADLAVSHVGGEAVSTSPPRVDLAVGGNGLCCNLGPDNHSTCANSGCPDSAPMAGPAR